MPPVFVSEDDFLLQNYTYELPQEQIAQYPPEQRGTSRLLTMRRNGALDLEHHMFSDLPACLPEGSLLVANNSRVLQARLLAQGGEYFADNRLTVADLKVFVDVRGLNSGRLDHVPTDLVERVAPALNAHANRIASLPAVQAYYAKFAGR